MNPKALTTAAFVASTLLAHTGAVKVEAKTAKCFFSVDGTIHINGPCRFEFQDNNGSFLFNDMKMKSRCYIYVPRQEECPLVSTIVTRRGTFGQLNITSPGKAKIYWNGGAAKTAQNEITPVTREGACWQNSRAKLCA